MTNQRKFTMHYPRRAIDGHTIKAKNCVLVSLRDPGTPRVKACASFIEVLELEFHDLPRDYSEMSIFSEMSEEELKEVKARWIAPHRDHAKAIAEFIRKHEDKSILVHCEAGVSRSAAVCRVLEEMGWEYRPITSFGTSHANPLLVRLLKKELGLSYYEEAK